MTKEDKEDMQALLILCLLFGGAACAGALMAL